jgi:SET domain-containing protein
MGEMPTSAEASESPRPVRPAKKKRASEAAFVVRKSTIQGRGVFAVRGFEEEELIVEYLGQRITHEVAGDRYDDESTRRHHTFLFSVDDELCIDGGREGNEARLINHSCEPNAYASIEKRRIFIRASRRIEAGEEIVYDYWYSTDPDYTLADLRRLYPCRCGAAKCRGTLAAPPKKPRAKKASAKKSRRNGSR